MQGDVYSLGVMLYQLVTAQPDAPLAEGWQRDVPDELLREDIALCVDGDPTRRLPSATDLATRLRTLDERRKKLTAAREAAATEQARRKRQRQLRFTVAAAVLIAAITIPLTFWALREKGNAQEQTRLAKKAETEADTERDKAKAQVREASRSDTATAQQRLAEGKWQEAVAYLGRAVRYDAENRNAQDALFLALRHGQRDTDALPEQVLKHESPVNSASFSPDGTRVVTACWDYTARVWDAKTGQPIGAPLKHEFGVGSASFSPDVTRVVTASGDAARMWDAKTGQPIGAPLKHEGEVRSASFSPDGTRVVTACSDYTARVWDAKTGQPIGAPLKHESYVNSASFSPDGTRVVTGSGDAARMWDTKTGQEVTAELAVMLTAFSAGARLDPELGSLHQLTNRERMAFREEITPFHVTSEDWRFVVGQTSMRDPRTALVSPRMTLTLREAATRLISTNTIFGTRQAVAIDPTHPILPFAHAFLEAQARITEPANPIRAAWLVDYGMKHLPSDTSATDLRLAAQLIAKVARFLPEQKAVALTLLDRALKLSPEEDDVKELRDSLK